VRAVLDTNVLLSGLFWRGAPHALLEQVRDDVLTPPAARILPCRRVAECRLSGISGAATPARNGSYSDWS